MCFLGVLCCGMLCCLACSVFCLFCFCSRGYVPVCHPYFWSLLLSSFFSIRSISSSCLSICLERLAFIVLRLEANMENRSLSRVKQAKAEGVSGEDLGDKIADMQIELKRVENEIQNVSRTLEQHRKKVGDCFGLLVCVRWSTCIFDADRKTIFRRGRERERDCCSSPISSCLCRLILSRKESFVVVDKVTLPNRLHF